MLYRSIEISASQSHILSGFIEALCPLGRLLTPVQEYRQSISSFFILALTEKHRVHSPSESPQQAGTFAASHLKLYPYLGLPSQRAHHLHHHDIWLWHTLQKKDYFNSHYL